MELAVRTQSQSERSGQRIGRPAESRTRLLLWAVEREAQKRLQRVLRRLEVPSRREIDVLSRRIAELERRVPARPAAAVADLMPCGAANRMDSVHFAEQYWDEV
jgi:hypothetical protein